VVKRSDTTGTMASGMSHPAGMPETRWHPGMRDDWRDAFLSGGGAGLTTG